MVSFDERAAETPKGSIGAQRLETDRASSRGGEMACEADGWEAHPGTPARATHDSLMQSWPCGVETDPGGVRHNLETGEKQEAPALEKSNSHWIR